MDQAPGRYGMIGLSAVMLELYARIAQLAGSTLPMLVAGETGTGKECVARALHDASSRRGRYVAINVGALPEHLLESELFGATRGAFTGSVDRAGLIEFAQGGTLVLDEAADLPPAAQLKLLRVLESGTVRRIGGTEERPARFRLVVTSQRSPQRLCASGQWRQDFYYRVSGATIDVPRLADRGPDIGLLASHFSARENLRSIEGSLEDLEQYRWPGNVRQLRHAVVRVAAERPLGPLTTAAILSAARDGGARAAGNAEVSTLREATRRHVAEVVSDCHGDTRRAAHLLGISRSQVYRRLQDQIHSR